MAGPTSAAANPKNPQDGAEIRGSARRCRAGCEGTGGTPPAEGARTKVRRASLLAGFVVVLVLLALASLAVGSKHIDLSTVLGALLHPDDSADHAIIRDSRVPRAILGVLAGSALGIAGALVQSMTRNALAEPGILGVNAGASLAIVIAVGTFGVNGFGGYVWFAFGGAVLATGAVYRWAWPGRGPAIPCGWCLPAWRWAPCSPGSARPWRWSIRRRSTNCGPGPSARSRALARTCWPRWPSPCWRASCWPPSPAGP